MAESLNVPLLADSTPAPPASRCSRPQRQDSATTNRPVAKLQEGRAPIPSPRTKTMRTSTTRGGSARRPGMARSGSSASSLSTPRPPQRPGPSSNSAALRQPLLPRLSQSTQRQPEDDATFPPPLPGRERRSPRSQIPRQHPAASTTRIQSARASDGDTIPPPLPGGERQRKADCQNPQRGGATARSRVPLAVENDNQANDAVVRSLSRQITPPGYRLLNSLSATHSRSVETQRGDREETLRFVPEPATAHMPPSTVGDESQTEDDSSNSPTESHTAKAQDGTSSPGKIPITWRGVMLCILFTLLILGSFASLLLRILLGFSCWFSRESYMSRCLNNNTTLSGNATVPVAMVTLGWWDLHLILCCLVLFRGYVLFHRPMRTRKWLSKLYRQNHFWLLALLTMSALSFDCFELSFEINASNYTRHIALSGTPAKVAASLWILEKLLTLGLVCSLNYRPELKAGLPLYVRLLYRANIVLFAGLNFCYFVSNSLFVTMKLMPDNRSVFYDGTENLSEQELKRLIAFLLQVANCIYRFNIAGLLSTKAFHLNKNLFHPIHADVFRYRTVSQYLSDVDIYESTDVMPSALTSSNALSPCGNEDSLTPYYESRLVTPPILQ